jgi:hypothetical protein
VIIDSDVVSTDLGSGVEADEGNDSDDKPVDDNPQVA